MACLCSRLRPWLTIRIRTLLVLVAVIAIAFGAYLEIARREERRRRWPYEILDAADVGDVPRIRRLLDEGANVDSVTDGRFPWTPLMKAAWRGRTDAVRLLLERGADPDHEDLDCFRSITLAAAGGYWDIVRILVERGADTTKSDGLSTTALGYAKEQGEEEMIRYLESRTPK